MTQLHELYQAGRLAVVVGAGNLAGNRSHFTAQDLWEFGATQVPPDALGLARSLPQRHDIGHGLGVPRPDRRQQREHEPARVPGDRHRADQRRSGSAASPARTRPQQLIRDEYFGNRLVEKTGTRALDAPGRSAASRARPRRTR